MRIAVMQPYIFPYLGYFQLIDSVDTFVFYDDVHFIKQGWINRNRILLNEEPLLLSFPCIKASSFKLINEIKVDFESKAFSKIKTTIAQTYRKAPFYDQVFPIVSQVLDNRYPSIGDLAAKSVLAICAYLGIETKFVFSSELFPKTKGMEKSARLKAICHEAEANTYINAIGGQELYDKADFKEAQIDLHFLQPIIKPYPQFGAEFISHLSIIDVLMFNSVERVREMVANYTLI